MDTAQKFEAFAKEKLKTVLKDSGHVLYSSAYTLYEGEIYLLGHNPGGSPEGREDESIENSLHNLAEKTTNEYLDDSWNGLAPGEAVLQKRVRWLLDNLNKHQLEFNIRIKVDIRKVCASNLIFSRSIDAKNSNFKKMANLCWPVHKYILKIVKPRMVLTFGNGEQSPFSFLQEKLGINIRHYSDSDSRPEGQQIRTVSYKNGKYPIYKFNAGHGDWECKAFYTKTGLLVVGLPHLSRYAIDHHHEVPRWIIHLLSKQVHRHHLRDRDRWDIFQDSVYHFIGYSSTGSGALSSRRSRISKLFGHIINNIFYYYFLLLITPFVIWFLDLGLSLKESKMIFGLFLISPYLLWYIFTLQAFSDWLRDDMGMDKKYARPLSFIFNTFIWIGLPLIGVISD